MIFEIKYPPDVLKTLKRAVVPKRVNVIVSEFLESGLDYIQLDIESCGCRPKSKLANINRYTYMNDISVRAIMVGDKCYMIRSDGFEKELRKRISDIHKQ